MATTFFTSACASLLLLITLFTSSHAAAATRNGYVHRSIYRRDLVVTNNLPTGWTSQGCYTDLVNSRSLYSATYTDTTAMTEESCIAFCSNKGYSYAGVEYSQECYCGNALAASAAAAAAGDCDMACTGNATEQCGGPDRLNLFHNGNVVQPTSGSSTSPGAPAWSSLGCYTDQVAERTLAVGMAVPGGPANMTAENCQNACHAAEYTLAGVEYAAECYCDNQLENGGGPAPDGNALCDMSCNGNPSETCGGPNRLNLYSYVGGATSSPTAISTPTATPTPTPTPTTTPTASVSATATSSTATSTGTGTAATLPEGWTYRGCYIDNTNGRILLQQPDSSTLTVEACVQTCIGLNYSVAGMEYSTQCFCGDYIFDGGSLASSDSDCAMTCGGNTAEICGGPNLMSIYATGTLTTYAAPVAQTTNLPGEWQYQGCLTDTPQPRVFPYQIDMETNLTIADCLGLCSEFGYSAGGGEYGNQCFCGDDSDRINAGATFQPAQYCNTPCSGDPTALCGGSNAINYYTWTGLNTWNEATGDAAGEYEFLIGGVVIPLITAQALTGKITFVEKHGTGPPNSTGAYELDLTEINNFTAAWRTMYGLKTDVFCSAGLTLPDKVGRQLNVGGWSATSLYGVRLYWPDGSAGVPGVNDWQENVAEVHLQTGRWYPSAMMMANGSILIVGGENGSNGPPVPYLEILPQPAGGGLIFCEFLNRTDPLNLYPFLAVLPSGGVFIAYYNEARILDENTFETTSVMPNIPGSVNRFDAGRTYPLEGTAMIMPQAAPYTDPLKVVICGGSTPYQGFALDNCVSIEPEVPGSNWTIERMPSKRVISCMVALPDGTYLILNGAQQGFAGFGLASEPNLNAILYTPTAPLNSRFTIMANTTIDRLYHSEAILLQDGRILVSGSDPEAAPYPQEYRVEVFIPPYLMGSPTQPTYSINNGETSYGYGDTITITMTGGTAAKISLMGAVSSTHGNSMGQRIYFPAFSCSGNTCSITTPPNAHTCPPAWFMLFVLDSDGVPSVAQWVRIGGDPAELGNWPNFPDFDIPGI